MSKHLISLLLLGGVAFGAHAEVYRCPGPPVLYTDALTAKEAQAKGCRSIDGTPITVVQSVKPRAPITSSAPAASTRGADTKVDSGQQRSRDDERRRVLQDELNQAQERLAQAQQEYNNGQGERRGDERNYQKYLNRMAGLKDSITRSQADIEALKREIAKLP